MNTLEVINKRRSYRGEYLETPVPREHLIQIMEAGLAAPSGSNKQTTSLIAVDDAGIIKKLYEVINRPLGATAPAMICVLTRRICAYKGNCYAVQDYAAAIENMLLAIVDLGYESCWVEGYVTDTDRVGYQMAQILGVPDEYELIAFLPVGVAKDACREISKLPFEKRAWFNGFGQNNEIRIMKKQPITTFEEAVEYLYKVPRFTTKNSPEDTRAYLRKLGNPEQNMKIIHVAGTNGKGSVCAYMRCILEEAGYTTAVFTSPHLVDIRERFLIKGQMVSKEAFLEAFLRVYNGLNGTALEQEKGDKQEKATTAYHPTFFEYLFFMAMLLFEAADVDYCILETGLGGRLDATNSVSRKELSVITRIGLDHVEYLGDTLEQIAGEKAGIMQAGAPVVFADTDEAVTGVFRNYARELGISAYSVSKKDYAFLRFQNKTIDFSVHTEYYDYVRLTLQTIAGYQMENAALAVRAIEVLDKGRTISAQSIIRGVEKCHWQGRMEEILPDVFVDGAHNDDGIRAFLETVKEDGCIGARMLLFGVVQDKDYAHMIDRLLDAGLFERIAIAHLHTARSAALESLKDIFEHRNTEQAGCAYTLHDSAASALQELLGRQRQGDRIYIAGSLYLVGEIKESLDHD